jgi:hypothetical protein
MANDSTTQQRLAADQAFQGRVRSAMATVAFQVLNEDPATPDHDKRATYAHSVLPNLTYAAQSATAWLVERPNLMAKTTSYDFPSGAVVTDATDADLESQIATDWNILAGV